MVEPLTAGVLGIIILILLLLIGLHIGIALIGAGLVGLTLMLGFEKAIGTITSSVFHQVSNYALITVPLFILMGFLAAGGGISATLYRSLTMWIGGLRGGLGMATVFGNAAFGTLTGSAIVSVTVFSKLAAPEMRRHGYDKNIAYGICTSAGSIGMLIPPSILMVLYGILGGVSVGDLLIAGVGPGLVLAFTISAAILLISWWRPDLIRPAGVSDVTWGRRFASLIGFWPVIVVVGIIFGGIFGGVFTPTEAAAVATFVMFVLLILLRRRTSLGHILTSLKDTATISSMIFLIFAGAEAFTRLMVLSGMTRWVLDGILGLEISNLALVLLLALFFVGMGMFLTSVSMLAITVPILAPVVAELGIDPIWFAMVVILAIHVGLITPPIGLNVYAAKGVAEPDVSLEDLFSGVMPFFVATLIALAIIIWFPSLSTALVYLRQ